MYSEEIVEEVRSRNDIVDVVSSYVHLEKKGANYFGLCPFHNEKSASFSVTPSKQMFFCFGCHKGGNVFTFLMEYNNETFVEALSELAARAGIALPEREMSKEEKARKTKRDMLKAVNKDATMYFYKQLKNDRSQIGMQYFREKRKLSDKTINSWGLGYADKSPTGLYDYLKSKGHSDGVMKESGLVVFDEKNGPRDYFFNRVMFPIANRRNEVVAFGGRVLGDAKPKYLNSPENELFRKRQNMYGLNIANKSRREMFILCEGYMDVIALHQAGFDNAVASLGTAITDGHVNLMKNARKKVYISYDNDEAGISAALRAIQMLRTAKVECKVIDMSPYNDPDEFIKAEGAEVYQRRIDDAENSFIYAVRMSRRKYNCEDPDQLNQFYRETAKRLCLVKTELERNSYIDKISEMYNISSKALQEIVIDEAKNTKDLERLQREFEGEVTEEENVTRRKKVSVEEKKKEALKETEGILLTWIFEEPYLYDKIKKYLTIEDFTEGIYRDMASEMFEAIDKGEEFNPASIMCSFEDDEAHNEIARMLHTKIENVSATQKEIILKETLLNLKKERKNNFDNSVENAGQKLRTLIMEIKEIERSRLI